MFTVGGWPALADHDGGTAPTYTGCLDIAGKGKGKVSKIQAGQAPIGSICKSGFQEVHLSSGDITALTSGTGLTGGGTEGDVTLDLLPSFRLPQSCASSGIAVWDGSSWVCGAQGTGVSSLVFSRTPVDTGLSDLSSIAVGTDGLPVISYRRNNDLRVIHCGDAACTSGNTGTIVDGAGTTGLFTSIAIGTDGLPVVSYQNVIDGLKVAHCGNASCTSGNTSTIVDAGTNNGRGTSIAIGTDGLPIVSYTDGATSDLKVAHCGNADCSSGNTVTPVDTGAVGDETSIAIGADGLPVISYADVDVGGGLKVAHCDNVACSTTDTTTVDASNFNTGGFSSIAIGSDGLPVISYRDFNNSQLKVAHCGTVDCTAGNTATPVVSAASVGFSTSIAIGADALPVVSYYEDSTDDLRVAHCGNVTCTAANTSIDVDTAGDVGFSGSIAIGTDGVPVISYADQTGTDLKVAHCSSPFCVPFQRPS